MATRKISGKSLNDSDKNPKESINVPRRRFLSVAGTVAVGVGMGGGLSTLASASSALHQLKSKNGIPVSTGYILVDTRKCQGCVSCMIACSLVNEGESNLSLSRIQILQNSFESFPDDITIEQCRQCVDPECLIACPVNAISADPENGFVRRVDAARCIGCGSCVKACPFVPSRPVVAPPLTTVPRPVSDATPVVERDTVTGLETRPAVLPRYFTGTPAHLISRECPAT